LLQIVQHDLAHRAAQGAERLLMQSRPGLLVSCKPACNIDQVRGVTGVQN